MERSWLQEQATLSKFDGYRDSEALSCVKPTAAPAPASILSGSALPPVAGGNVEVVYDPEDLSADWSGFVPRYCVGRRMHSGSAAYRETIQRTENGIIPAADATTQDSIRLQRRHCAESSTEEVEGVLLGGPSTVDPEERFTTCTRAANEQKPALPEMKGAGWSQKKSTGKRHITPAYERGASNGVLRSERGMPQAGNDLWTPPGGRLLCPPSTSLDDPQGTVGYRVRASPNAPGSLLQGLGRQVAESEATVPGFYGSNRINPKRSGEMDDDSVKEPEAGMKGLSATNYNPYLAGYTGHKWDR